MKFGSIVRSLLYLNKVDTKFLRKTYTQPKKKGDKVKPARMSVEDLDRIVLADPTTRRDGDTIKKAGTYTTMVIKTIS